MRLLTLAFLAVALWPAGSWAEEDNELARAHFMTGRSYYDQQHYADALKEFEEAYRISKRAGFLYNIGVCDEKLGRDEEALSAFQGYLGASSDPAERADLQSRIEALKAKLALRAKSTPATTLVTAPATGAGERPVWKRGWFWGVMTSAAVVVATGIAVGVVIGTADSGPRTLPDVRLR
jgi:tetratricopeptide (TPR) repeat protein